MDANTNGVPDECEAPPVEDCNSNGVADELEPDCDTNGTPDDCDLAAGAPDADSDGVLDACDACPDTVLVEGIVIDGCDTGVADVASAAGCSLLESLAACAEGPGHHGGYVSCVAHATNDFKDEGLISGAEKGAIQSCAARSGIP